MAYRFEHSVEVGLSREEAWRFWTDVENWKIDAAIEAVKLDGPFQAGAKGITKTKGADLVEWKVADVSEGQSAVIEIEMRGAVAHFTWRFEDASAGSVRLRQEITLSGEMPEVYVEQMGEGFEQGIREGMRKLAAWMEESKGKR